MRNNSKLIGRDQERPPLKEEKEREKERQGGEDTSKPLKLVRSFVRSLSFDLREGKKGGRGYVYRAQSNISAPQVVPIATIRPNRRLGHGGQNDQQRRIQSRETLSLSLSLVMWNDVDRGTVTLTRTSLRILQENRSQRSIALLRGY